MPERTTDQEVHRSSPIRFFSGPGLSPGREFLGLGLILMIFMVVSWESLKQKSVTIDEFAHLPAGLSYLRTGDFRLEPINSPLIRLLAALPLAGSEVQLPLQEGWKTRDIWRMGREFMEANAASYQEIYERARLVMVALGALLVVLIWGWARKLYGPASGLAAALLSAFDPNVMAHSQLVTGDLGGALTFAAAVFALWTFGRRPSWPRVILAGVSLALALLSKFTALLLLPLLPALAIGYRLGGGTRLSWRKMGARIALMYLIAWIIIGSVYRWHDFGAPLSSYSFQSHFLQKAAAHLPKNLPVLLPSDCVRGLDILRFHNEKYSGGYFLGKISSQSHPLYYLVALAAKTPLTTLALLALGLGSFLIPGKRLRQDEIFLWGPPLLILAFITFYGRINVGLRHVLPAFPFLFIIASRPWALFFHLKLKTRVALALLIVGTITSNLLIFPHYLAYFNLAAGGPGQGYRILADSNLDWGQDLIGLKHYMDQEGMDRICLDYFGKVDPKIYGIAYDLPDHPEQCAVIAVSVQQLLGFTYRKAGGLTIAVADESRYAWLKKQTPVTAIGHSIWIFRPGEKIGRESPGSH